MTCWYMAAPILKCSFLSVTRRKESLCCRLIQITATWPLAPICMWMFNSSMNIMWKRRLGTKGGYLLLSGALPPPPPFLGYNFTGIFWTFKGISISLPMVLPLISDTANRIRIVIHPGLFSATTPSAVRPPQALTCQDLSHGKGQVSGSLRALAYWWTC